MGGASERLWKYQAQSRVMELDLVGLPVPIPKLLLLGQMTAWKVQAVPPKAGSGKPMRHLVLPWVFNSLVFSPVERRYCDYAGYFALSLREGSGLAVTNSHKQRC